MFSHISIIDGRLLFQSASSITNEALEPVGFQEVLSIQGEYWVGVEKCGKSL